MRIAIAYLSVVLLWATTPLAIKWSAEGPGFLFGVTGRMVIGTFCIVILLLIMKQRLTWRRKARLTYLAAALQIYGSMVVVYWAAQFIPSGWISVLFGLTPLITALLASLWLGQRELNFGKLLSYLLGVGGLAIMFGSALTLGRDAVLGIAAVIFGVFLHSFSALWIKRIDAGVPALAQVAGGLLVALPAYLLTWGVFDGEWPGRFTLPSVVSIVYLGVIATTAGFVLYYYLLTQLSATRVALITLISPVLALLLGHAVNHEPITPNVLAGALSIFSALLLHEYGGQHQPGGRTKALHADADIPADGNRPAVKRSSRYR
ncbi:DMT family transporter [Methylomicrobium sp. Wu6]|uniref:DMT family transporter n=1 Tax=Methylomicrobium sp. Wu6 TaxID=3107928 RepID=UPI002DD69E2E|nr:DMT family transporter [Methylomicrobium sp. Wu6]MEC4747859.1 DMT family transporter [Methylomicrobium sp. Wu6]